VIRYLFYNLLLRTCGNIPCLLTLAVSGPKTAASSFFSLLLFLCSCGYCPHRCSRQKGEVEAVEAVEAAGGGGEGSGEAGAAAGARKKKRDNK
jgi:hypothetical protein